MNASVPSISRSYGMCTLTTNAPAFAIAVRYAAGSSSFTDPAGAVVPAAELPLVPPSLEPHPAASAATTNNAARIFHMRLAPYLVHPHRTSSRHQAPAGPT